MQHADQKISLLRAVMLYVAALFLFLLAFIFAASSQASHPGYVVAFAYAALGVFLNRLVLRRIIEWHPIYNTLENVSFEKLKYMLLWPFAYPMLFLRLLVDRLL